MAWSEEHEGMMDALVSLLMMCCEDERMTKAAFRAFKHDPRFLPEMDACIERLRQQGKIRPRVTA